MIPKTVPEALERGDTDETHWFVITPIAFRYKAPHLTDARGSETDDQQMMQ